MNPGQTMGLVLVLLASAACAQKQPALYASPADQAAYAERYPAALGGARARYGEDEKNVGTVTAGFAKYPDELTKPDWTVVSAVIEDADQAGKSGDLASGMAEADAVRTFYAGERDKLRQKVGGSAEHAAKEKNCEVELYGPIGGALDRAMEQQLEERLRARNAAHRRIEDNVDAIGKPNVEKLEKQADEVALASYVVNVRMPTLKRDLDAALGDASGVKKTLEREIEEANAVAADPNAPKGKKQTAEKRKAAASSALASLDQEVTQAKALSDELEKRNDAAKKTYDQALDGLKDALEAKAKAEPAPAAAKK
jgi:hypothetical protein